MFFLKEAAPRENESKPLGNWKLAIAFAVFGLVASFLISYLSYFQAVSSPFNGSQAFASLLFWVVVLGVCLSFPLRGAFRAFLGYIKTVRGFAVYAIYTSLHLLVYGIILETIVAVMYPSFWDVPVQGGVVLSSQPLYPLTGLTLLGNFFFNPNLAALVPPIFDVSLSLYSIALAVIIGILVQVNVMRTIELRNTCSLARRSTAFIALPVIGVVGGASCCLSLPLFVTLLAAPTVSLASPSIIAVYFLTYFLFPPGTAVILKLNLDSINRVKKAFSQETQVSGLQ